MNKIYLFIKSKYFFIFLTAFSICCFIFTAISVDIFFERLSHAKKYAKDFTPQYEYRILDNYHNEEWADFYYDPDVFSKLVHLNAALHTNENFEYYEVLFQEPSVYKESYAGDYTFGTNYEWHPDSFYDDEEIASVCGMYVDHGYLEKNNISVLSGRSFVQEDHYIVADKIPIILGSRYEELYAIGNTIDVFVLGKKRIGEVIGFLPSGSYIEHAQMIFELDSYMLLPIEYFDTDTSMNVFDNKHEFRILLEKNNGVLFSDLNDEEIKLVLTDIFKKSGLELYYVANGPTLKTSQNRFFQLFVFSSISLMVSSASTVLLTKYYNATKICNIYIYITVIVLSYFLSIWMTIRCYSYRRILLSDFGLSLCILSVAFHVVILFKQYYSVLKRENSCD